MIAPSPAIQYERISRRFHSPARGEVWALRDVSFACPAGGLTVVVGPSGCGKTTLLRLAAGLDQPTSGTARVRASDGAGDGVGLVSQEGDLLPWRRVAGNVALGLEIRRMPRAQRRSLAMKTLHRVGLSADVARSFPHELSGGMRRRVALARALCARSRVLLMDEPFDGLDEPTRHRLQEEFTQLWLDEELTILLATHNVEEAVYLADRVVVMTFGSVVAEMPVDLPRPRNRLADAFVQRMLAVRKALAEHETPDRRDSDLPDCGETTPILDRETETP